jgi:hypothetical protein
MKIICLKTEVLKKKNRSSGNEKHGIVMKNSLEKLSNRYEVSE